MSKGDYPPTAPPPYNHGQANTVVVNAAPASFGTDPVSFETIFRNFNIIFLFDILGSHDLS